MKRKIFLIAAVVAMLAVAVLPLSASASHSWGNYHWARTSNPFTLKLVDNVPSTWDAYLVTASSDWTASSVLNTTIVPGNTKDKCNQGTSGQIKVCASRYGNNGWLGLASIWADAQSHITAGVTKMNDTYFNTATYNTPAWRQFVMCQEIGHTFGLDHQDEAFNNANLGSCMDYTNNPSTNQHPNAHDYAQLEAMYAHLDSTTTITASTIANGAAGPANGQDGEDWGAAVRADAKGRGNLFVKQEGNTKKITWVLWAD